jgi:hypothetical protein
LPEGHASCRLLSVQGAILGALEQRPIAPARHWVRRHAPPNLVEHGGLQHDDPVVAPYGACNHGGGLAVLHSPARGQSSGVQSHHATAVSDARAVRRQRGALHNVDNRFACARLPSWPASAGHLTDPQPKGLRTVDSATAPVSQQAERALPVPAPTEARRIRNAAQVSIRPSHQACHSRAKPQLPCRTNPAAISLIHTACRYQ